MGVCFSLEINAEDVLKFKECRWSYSSSSTEELQLSCVMLVMALMVPIKIWWYLIPIKIYYEEGIVWRNHVNNGVLHSKFHRILKIGTHISPQAEINSLNDARGHVDVQ